MFRSVLNINIKAQIWYFIQQMFIAQIEMQQNKMKMKIYYGKPEENFHFNMVKEIAHTLVSKSLS